MACRTSTRLLAAATAFLLVPAVTWAGSRIDAFPPVAPGLAAASDPFAFTYGEDAAADEPLRLSRSPLLDEATPTAGRSPPREAAVVPDASEPDYGPQVVPLPPALYPGLVLLGIAFLRFRRA